MIKIFVCILFNICSISVDKQSEGTKLPFLVTCPVEPKNKIPTSVSLTANDCDNAENKLQIINNKPANDIKQRFGVCTKALSTDKREFIVRFIEWVHILRILGTDKITLFNEYVHPELFNILNFFQNKSFIEYSQFVKPSNVNASHLTPNQGNILELMQLTDCFYKTRNLYDYIAVMNTDEVIVPMKPEDKTWHDLVKNFDLSRETVSFLSLNAIIPNLGKPLHADIPNYHYMLQHTQVRSLV